MLHNGIFNTIVTRWSLTLSQFELNRRWTSKTAVCTFFFPLLDVYRYLNIRLILVFTEAELLYFSTFHLEGPSTLLSLYFCIGRQINLKTCGDFCCFLVSSSDDPAMHPVDLANKHSKEDQFKQNLHVKRQKLVKSVP